jgi:hypothetical protein
MDSEYAVVISDTFRELMRRILRQEPAWQTAFAWLDDFERFHANEISKSGVADREGLLLYLRRQVLYAKDTLIHSPYADVVPRDVAAATFDSSREAGFYSLHSEADHLTSISVYWVEHGEPEEALDLLEPLIEKLTALPPERIKQYQEHIDGARKWKSKAEALMHS